MSFHEGREQKQTVAIALSKSREDDAVATGTKGRAAGILFHTPDGEILFTHRGDGGDFPRTWGLPAGHQEEGEELETTARREAFEETGYTYSGELKKVHDDGYFCTYAAAVDKFDVKLCDESTGYSWAKPSDAPSPLHPSLNGTLRIFGARTELDVAELMRDGVLPSPQVYSNVLLVDLRITGTGAAYRERYKEHVWRDAEICLNEKFLRRCNGLICVLDHPESKSLTSEEFEKRACGAVFVPYIKGDEIWAIARIYTKDAIEEILEGEISTSPGVVFNKASGNIKAQMENGEIILIEGNPALIDHIAIVTKRRGSLGVWDKGGPPAGVSLNNEDLVMADEEKVEKKADAADPMKAVMDALGGVMGKIDDIGKRMDDIGKRMDAAEAKPKEAIVDKKDEDKKDAEEKAEKDRKDAADKAEKDAKRHDEDATACANAQHRADAAYAALGDTAPRRMDGEGGIAYRVRLLRKLQPHSSMYKDVNLNSINDDALLRIAETTIINDAQAAARRPLDFAGGGLREIVKPSRTGHTVIEFAGDSRTWLADFMMPPKCIAFNSPRSNRSI
jgi:8-oxo-dGTP pyrophosphatase MutT (NUDIX family)